MILCGRFRSGLLARVSTIAIIAAASSLGTSPMARAQCSEALIVSTTPITGTHPCAIATFVTGNVVNNGIIGPPGNSEGDYDYEWANDLGEAGFFVGKGGITGSLLNNGFIAGGGTITGDTLGALTIGTNVSAGIINAGTILSDSGNGIQLGYGTSDGGYTANMSGSITNTGTIWSDVRDGVAAINGLMSGGLHNAAGATIHGGAHGVYIDDDFIDWAGGISNAGTIEGHHAGIQVGSAGLLQGVEFGGGITNEAGGLVQSVFGPAILAGGSSFSGGIINHGTITQTGVDFFVGKGSLPQTGILVSAHTFNDGITNTGRIDGMSGPAILIKSMTTNFNGGISNAGVISGFDTGISIKSTNFSGGIQNSATGLITASSSSGAGIYASTTWQGDLTNNGTILGGETSGIGVLFSGTDFVGNVTNTGTISGGYAGFSMDGPEGSFNGGGETTAEFVNSNLISGGVYGLYIGADQVNANLSNIFRSGPGAPLPTITGGSTGVAIEPDAWEGNVTNAGLIEGGIVGLRVNALSFHGDIINSGTIDGGVTGVRISSGVFSGDIVNNGTILGGTSPVPVEGDPGLFIVTGTHTGNIINNSTLSAGSNALFLDITQLIGSVTNSGLIESTVSGTDAVYLLIDNGTTFNNVGGGLIHGHINLDGVGAYAFVAGDGGVTGNIIGNGGNSTAALNDTVAVGNGTQYFIGQGSGSGSASNLLSFNVNAGGAALMGANSFGSTGGNGYNLVNVGSLNVNSGGTLYVDNQSALGANAFTQAAGSTLAFYLGEPGVPIATPGVHFGQINVNGPVTLGGTLQVVLDPTAFSGTTITQFQFNDVISGTSPVGGNFSGENIYGGSAFFQLSHLIDGNTVDLRLSRTAFNAVSCSANGDQLGSALEALFTQGNLTPDQQALFNYLGQLSVPDACSSYDSIGGAALADFSAIVVETAGPWKSLVNDRLNGLGSAGCNLAGPGSCFNVFAANEFGATQTMTDASNGVDPFDWLRTGTRRVGETAAWGRMIGVWGGTDGSSGVGGMDFVLTGMIAGIDHVFSPTLLAGVAAQWTTDDVSFKGRLDDASIDSFEVGSYVSWGDTRLYLNVNTSFIWHDFGTARLLPDGIAFGKYNGTTWSAYAEAGRIFETDDLRIQPILAASFAQLDSDAYNEFGTSGTLLAVDKAGFTSFKTMVGSRFAMPIGLESGRKMVPEARAVWSHEFADDRSSFTAEIQSVPGRFTVSGQRYARDTFILGVGLTAPLSDEASLSLDYDAGINPDIVTHTMSAGFRLKW